MDDLLIGRLPQHVIDILNQAPLSIEEILEWEASKPKIRIVLTEKGGRIETRYNFPIKRVLAIFGGVGGLSGLLWMIKDFIVR